MPLTEFFMSNLSVVASAWKAGSPDRRNFDAAKSRGFESWCANLSFFYPELKIALSIFSELGYSQYKN